MKTRIIFSINNLDTAGMKYVLAALVKGIDKDLFTPVIVVYHRTGSSLEKELEKNIEVHELNLRYPGILSFIPSLMKNVRILKQLGSLVHSFDYSSDWHEAITLKLAGIPYLVEKTNLSMVSYRWKLKLGLAKHIVCLSDAQAQQLRNYTSKLSIIPTGINVQAFNNADKIPRKQIGLTDEDVIFICVAHLVEVKGYEELIQAVSIIKNEIHNLKIICVGKGTDSYLKKLKDLAKENGVSESFIFLGGTDNVAGYLKTADIKILATQNRGRREAFGAAVVEAMAAGLPVLATRSGGPEEIVVDGVTGWLVNGNGYEALIEGMRKVMSDRKSWRYMGEAARQRAVDYYNEDRMIDNYSAVYKKIVASAV